MTIYQPMPDTADSGHRFDQGRRWAASLTLGFEGATLLFRGELANDPQTFCTTDCTRTGP